MCSNLAIRINDRLGNGYFNESFFFPMHLLFMSLINLQNRKKISDDGTETTDHLVSFELWTVVDHLFSFNRIVKVIR